MGDTILVSVISVRHLGVLTLEGPEQVNAFILLEAMAHWLLNSGVGHYGPRGP